MWPLWHSHSVGSEPGVVVRPGAAGLYGTPTPWDPSQLWWYAQERLLPRQPPAPSPISGLLDSVLTPGIGVRRGGSALDAAQVYYHFQLNHAQVTVPAPPCCGAYGGPRRNRRSNYHVDPPQFLHRYNAPSGFSVNPVNPIRRKETDISERTPATLNLRVNGLSSVGNNDVNSLCPLNAVELTSILESTDNARGDEAGGMQSSSSSSLVASLPWEDVAAQETVVDGSSASLLSNDDAEDFGAAKSAVEDRLADLAYAEDLAQLALDSAVACCIRIVFCVDMCSYDRSTILRPL
ncbi:unnamed protein product [Schistocephalus solidus]|uniref:Pecanex-like protein n=1 Tax=Schistocephalus solidus TaxID=70667 RepID=A0A183SUN7_SCHSO|nr:unnamed protein product [Schistocephalus solidus]